MIHLWCYVFQMESPRCSSGWLGAEARACAEGELGGWQYRKNFPDFPVPKATPAPVWAIKTSRRDLLGETKPLRVFPSWIGKTVSMATITSHVNEGS